MEAAMQDEALLVSKRQAALSLGVSVRTLERLMADGRVPFVLLRHRRLIPQAALRRIASPV